MENRSKYIGINQRIPFEVLDFAVETYLTRGEVEKEHLFQRMLEYTTGQNRAGKAVTYIVQILSRQKSVLNKLNNLSGEINYSSLLPEERKAFCLCLISLTYPITYHLLIALSQGFKVQEQINKKFISEKVKNIYGSNRTVDVAIDALLPMIIELNTIKRDKISIYSKGKGLVVTDSFIAELIIYTDVKLSGSKSILSEDLHYRPWYLFFDLPLNKKFNHLIKSKESTVGKGYLYI